MPEHRAPPPARGFWAEGWRGIRRSPSAVAGGLVVVGLVVVALAAPLIAPYDPLQEDLDLVLEEPYGPKPPSLAHPFGTDDLGRDLFSRVVYGARISLQVGVLATVISLAIGITLGALAGYHGGVIDLAIGFATDVAFSVPTAILAIGVLAVVARPSVIWIFLVLGFLGWASVVRVVRGKVLSVREEDFTMAAQALGAGAGRVILRHVLPNCLAPVMVVATIMVAGNILTEAWLSFLGLGAQPPTPSWGLMITEGQPYLATDYWVCLFPGLAVAITVLGFNLLGDGLRDALDPRMKP